MSALTATMKLDPAMVIAAISGRSTRPKAGAKTPAAIGRATALYPTAQPRFCFILRTVPRPIRRAMATSRGSERIRTTSAVSTATSVPAPMAIPKSACASAGASLTPSPTMATRLPASMSSLTLAALSPGSTSAMTLVMPSSAAIRAAVAALSPVSITTSTPRSRNSATAAAEVGRTASAMPKTATARPSTAASTEVLPAAASASCRGPSTPTSTDSASISRRLPTATRCPSTVATAPCPAMLANSLATRLAAPAVSARCTTALASGCSDSRSTAAISARASLSGSTSTMRSVTCGAPIVKVPVLSMTTTLMRLAVSIAVAFLNSTPRLAPRPVPTMIAVGVARPRASGQVTTTTVMANSSASWTGLPASIHTAKVPTPPTSATKTSQNAARSAKRWPGALEFWASWTSLTICASAVSAPTLVARTRSVPVVLIVAPTTSSPGVLCTGMLSPVTVDSSMSLSPDSITPSEAILEPGRTSNRSPTTT